jgi:hypothetical protein
MMKRKLLFYGLFLGVTGSLCAETQTNATQQAHQQQKQTAVAARAATAQDQNYNAPPISSAQLAQLKQAQQAAAQAATQQKMVQRRNEMMGGNQLRWQQRATAQKEAEALRAQLILAQKPTLQKQTAQETSTPLLFNAAPSLWGDDSRQPTDSWLYVNPLFQNPSNPYQLYRTQFPHLKNMDLYLKYNLRTGIPAFNF